MMKRGCLKVTNFWITCNNDGQVIIDNYVIWILTVISNFSATVFSRALFSFHGCLFRIFSRGRIHFFTGVFLTKFSRAKTAFHAHFLVNFQNFSREPFCFSRAKSRNIWFFSREPFRFSRPKKNTDVYTYYKNWRKMCRPTFLWV